MKNQPILLGLLILQSAFCLVALGQGTAFTYQGRLNDGANPANGIYDLRFGIYDSLAGGLPQGGPLTNSAAGVTNGLFTVTLDFGNQFLGAGRWLEISVRTNGGGAFAVLSPRQPLTAVPYSIYAGNAGLAASVPAAGIGAGTANINISGNAVTATSAAAAASAVNANFATLAGAATSATLAGFATNAAFAGTATNLAGILPDAQLSTNIARLNSTNLFLGSNTFSGVVIATNPANQIYGTFNGMFTGNAAGLSNLTSVAIAPGSITSSMLATGAVTSAQLAAGAVSLQNLNTRSVASFSFVVPKPDPRPNTTFGDSFTMLGTDKFVLGNEVDEYLGFYTGAGTIQVFTTATGTLLSTIRGPYPHNGDRFGHSIATVGNDRLLVGAYGFQTPIGSVGAAFLLQTNGTMMLAITNPTPANNDKFGYAVAALGNDRLLISAPSDFNAPNSGGSVYLFNTNGTLLNTFNNHPSSGGDKFGNAVAVIGSDKIVISDEGYLANGQFVGAVSLFTTNGTLLTVITNPTPQSLDYFGHSMVVLGSDKLVIGAPQVDGTVTDSGAVYVYTTNGTRLLTITNPATSTGTHFGESVCAYGNDQFLVGAPGDDSSGVTFGGAAYLFDLSGALDATFRKHTPAPVDAFGNVVGKFGNNQIIAIAPNDDLNSTDAGAAYIYSLGSVLPGLASAIYADGSISDVALSTNVALRTGGNVFSGSQFFDSGSQFFSGGNVGINTTNPAATLDVNGTFRAGNGTTIFKNLQGGIAQMTGGSSMVKTNFTFTFPKAFSSVPTVVISATSGNVVSVDDTFAVTVRAVTTTACTVNVVRVDNPTGWSQSVKISWIAWE